MLWITFSPQRSDTKRIDYCFLPSKNEIALTIRHGKEITTIKNGEYQTEFQTAHEEKHVIDYSSAERGIYIHGAVIIRADTEHPHVEVLKPYGNDSRQSIAHRFPAPTCIHNDSHENQLNLKSSLTPIEQDWAEWQVKFIDMQSYLYNFTITIQSESNNANRNPSSLIVRSQKVGILLLSFIYIENILHFYHSILHAHFPNTEEPSIEQSKTQNLNDIKRFNERMFSTFECISAIAKTTNINKQHYCWKHFVDYKKSRNELTHPKTEKPQTAHPFSPSSAVSLSFFDMLNIAAMLCWFNQHVDAVSKSLTPSTNFELNGPQMALLLKSTALLAGKPYTKYFKEFGFSEGSQFSMQVIESFQNISPVGNNINTNSI